MEHPYAVDGHRGTCLRIATRTRRMKIQEEGAKSANLNALVIDDRLPSGMFGFADLSPEDVLR